MKPDFTEFTNEVIRQLNKKLGNGCKIFVRDIIKNNGVGYKAVVISDGIHNTSPCIPIDSYYELYQRPEDACMIADDILKFHRQDRFVDINLEGLMDREKVLGQVMFRVAGTAQNAPFLKSRPHYDIPELNMSMLFYINISIADIGQSSIDIQNKHMEMLHIKRKELAGQAWKNTFQASPPKITSIGDLLTESIGHLGTGIPLDDIKNLPMYIITNSQILYGAGYILYPDVQKQAAQIFKSDFYILPSSVHETIALPATNFDKSQAQNLKEMVMEINRSELAREDVLLNNVFYYSREKHKLYLAV